MLTLVRTAPTRRTSADRAALIADYSAFARHRAFRRQFLKMFGGLAFVILLGAAIGTLPRDESLIAEGMLVTPAVGLVAVDAVQWRRLIRRLDRVRAEVQAIKKS